MSDTALDQAVSAAVFAPVLRIEGLSIALPKGAERGFAVAGLDLVLRSGEVTCLVGESGSGKSMVAKAVIGLLPPRVRINAGTLAFGDVDLARLDAARMRRLRGTSIGMVFQEPMTALNPLHRVGRQVDEVLRLHTRLGRRARRTRVLDLLAEMHLPDPAHLVRAYPHQLSGGQRQRVVIAMALALRPKLLIADEPTTALDVTTQAQILHLLRALQREHGTAVLFITHDFGVVADIADRVAVLQRGTLVEEGPRDAVLRQPQHDYTRLLLNAVPGLRPPAVSARRQTPQVLEAQHISKSFNRFLLRRRPTVALDDVSLMLHRGETLGIVGESGSGKSTLARILASLARPDTGEVILNGEPITHLGRRQLRSVRPRIQMIFQDPYASLDPRQRAADIVAEGPIIHGTDPLAARARAKELLGLVGLDASSALRYPHEFSGGQRQRIGIARALALQPDILIADEAVSGLDVSVQAQVLRLLAEIKEKLALSVVFVTHDLRVALQICDRIAVMQAGRVVELATATEIYDAPQNPYTRSLFAAVPGAAWNERPR
jgi:peptide/nickel transport system ATP-binding protein